MRRFAIILSLLILLIFPSCNWNMYSSGLDDIEEDQSAVEGINESFTGEAPRNIYASQSNYPGRVVVSFDAVVGADSYDIERTVRDRNGDREETPVWKIISTMKDNGSARYTYIDNTASDGSKVYTYRVRANSLYAEITAGIKGEYSAEASGWPLSPPISLSATQGTYTDRIVLEWSRMDLVRGYDLYAYVPDDASAEIWSKINTTTIPSSYGTDTISYSYYPAEDAYGKDIYFKVRSISRGGSESGDSGYRTGYTFKVGSPLAPEELNAGDAVSSIYIPITWKKPDTEGAEGSYYRWEIMRSTPITDEVTVKVFPSNALPRDVLLVDGYYTYQDMMASSELEPGVEYTYTVRAVLVEQTADGIEESIGIAASDTGKIISPSITIGETETIYPSADTAGSFSFTIAAPPADFTDTSGWSYNIYGRKNILDREVGDWKLIETIPVSFDPITVTVDYGVHEVNEFDVRILDKEGKESIGYASFFSTPVVTERAPAPDTSLITVTKNRWNNSLKENANGVYPVVLTVGNDSTFTEYQVEAVSADGKSQGTISVKNDETITLDTLSPAKPGEIWQYRIRGTDVFGRYSAWSGSIEGYGALTGHAFIKFFEAYAMKPWEFVNSPDFPQNLKTKWNKSTIHSLIDKHGLGSLGDETEFSDFHGGTIRYHSYADGVTGDVEFFYVNFGELECIYSNGSYKMDNVNMNGNNGKCSGTMTVSGMYPATVDFSSLGVTGYAFSGKYKVTQDNGRGMEEVQAVRNE